MFLQNDHLASQRRTIETFSDGSKLTKGILAQPFDITFACNGFLPTTETYCNMFYYCGLPDMA